MSLESALAEAASLCVTAAIVIFLFRAGRRLKMAKKGIEQLEKTLEENKPEGIDK
jgi:hypothetical protein